MKKGVIFFMLISFLLISCSSSSDSAFKNVYSTSTVKIDDIDDSDFYFIYYTFDVDNRSNNDVYFYIDILPQNEKMKELIGENYRVPSFQANMGPQLFSVWSRNKEHFGVTLSIPKDDVTYKELNKMVKEYHYQFVNEFYTVQYKK